MAHSITAEPKSVRVGERSPLFRNPQVQLRYPLPNQILITPTSIYMYTQDGMGLVPVEQLGVEADRVYAILGAQTFNSPEALCTFHEIVCPNCHGCDVPDCRGYCKCKYRRK